MDKKRIIFAIIFLIVVIGMGYVLYRIFFRPGGTTIVPQTPSSEVTPPDEFPDAGINTGVDRPTAEPPGTLPDSPSTIQDQPTASQAEAVVQQVVTNRISAAGVNSRGDLRFYNKEDGKFYKLNNDGSATLLEDRVFFNAESVTWSPQNNESIIEYPDGANIYYNFDSGKQVTLPKHWENFSFSPSGDKIAAKSIGFSEENRWLVTSDPDGGATSLIEPLGNNANKVDIEWSPNNQVVATSRTGEALGGEREEILLVGLNGENFRSFVAEGRGFESKWSPNGTKMLYSVYASRNDFKPELWIVNAQGANIGSGRKPLGVSTWSNKCTFADDRFVYCAVPIDLPNGAGFQPGLANSTPDAIFKIDTETGLRTQLDTRDQDFNVIDTIFVGNNGRTLFFTDKQFSGLFSVTL